MKQTAIALAVVVAACSPVQTAPGAQGGGMSIAEVEQIGTMREPPAPDVFWIWADEAEARGWMAEHPRAGLCPYRTPYGPATGLCNAVTVPVDGAAEAEEMGRDDFLGGAFACLEFIPARRVLQSCAPEFAQAAGDR